jgi:hypothetical protein
MFSVDTVNAKSVVLRTDENERMRGVKMEGSGKVAAIRLWDRSYCCHVENIVREM